MSYLDLGAWAVATLKANTTLTGMVVAGADGVFESGDLNPRDLEVAEKTRLDGGTSEVLAVLVMDTGEQNLTATCAVFIYDHGQGYTYIRNAREAVIETLVNQPVVLARGAHIVQVVYRARTGHAIFSDFGLDYERVDFEGALVVSEDVYT